MAQKAQVPQAAVDALQRGDLVSAFKTLRQQGGGVNLQAIGNVLEAHAREYAQQQGKRPAQAPAAAQAAVREAGAEAVARLDARRRARERPPTVAMGDPPGSMRWLLVLMLLAAAGWIATSLPG